MKNKATDIFFDLDDTLWDFQRNSKRTFAFIFEKYRMTVNYKAFMRAYSPINDRYWKLYRQEKIGKKTLRLRRLEETFTAINEPVARPMIQQIARDYQAYLSEFNHLIPDAKATLTYLYNRYNLHILTNGFTAVQRKKLEKAAIETYFKTLTTPEIAGVKKPSREIFDAALQLAGTHRENSVMIGDNWEVDMVGADKAGFMTVYFDKKKTQKPQTEYTIKNLIELKTLF